MKLILAPMEGLADYWVRQVLTACAAYDWCVSEFVRVNGELVSQPSFQVKPGDRINLKLERRDLVLEVKTGGERRGPFEEARLLYEDLTPPAEEVKKLTLFEQAQRMPGSGRPSKKDRRALDRLFPEPDTDSR